MTINVSDGRACVTFRSDLSTCGIMKRAEAVRQAGKAGRRSVLLGARKSAARATGTDAHRNEGGGHARAARGGRRRRCGGTAAGRRPRRRAKGLQTRTARCTRTAAPAGPRPPRPAAASRKAAPRAPDRQRGAPCAPRRPWRCPAGRQPPRDRCVQELHRGRPEASVCYERSETAAGFSAEDLKRAEAQWTTITGILH